jgi:tetratricopeptide (TPR) repeat protein
MDNLAGAANLIGEVNDMKEEHSVVSELGGNQHDQAPTIPSLINMLSKEDDRASLMKGDFLFRAGHFASSLKIFQQLQSKMESCEFFDGMSSADAAGLHSEVNGKIGHVYMKLASFDLAIVYFGRQLSLAEEENLGAQKTCALLGLGTCYLEKYDCLYAETLLKRALDLCLSRGDNANTLVAYTNLKKTYEVLNRPEAAVFAVKIKDMDVSSWKREFGGTAVSRHEVKDALKKLDSMTLRLSNTYPSQVIKLEAASSHQVQLQKALSDRDRELIEALEHLTVSELESKELQGLLEQIEAEIIEAKYSKKNTLTSILLQGSKQDIKTATLQFRLEEELKIIRAKLANSLAEISATNMMIHNARDDVAVLKDEICVEGGPLMGRVLTGRKYRCASFNVSNVIRDDVCGVTTNGEWVALSEGQTCYIHSLRTGNLKHVFIDNEDDCTATATVSSLIFYGDRVYTGTMGGGEGERASLVAWHIPTSKMLLKAKAHGSGITSLWADDSKIVSGSADKSIILWSVDGVLICRVCGHSRGIHSLLCGPKWLVSASHDTVFVWDIKQTENKFHEVISYTM